MMRQTFGVRRPRLPGALRRGPRGGRSVCLPEQVLRSHTASQRSVRRIETLGMRMRMRKKDGMRIRKSSKPAGCILGCEFSQHTHLQRKGRKKTRTFSSIAVRSAQKAPEIDKFTYALFFRMQTFIGIPNFAYLFKRHAFRNRTPQTFRNPADRGK